MNKFIDLTGKVFGYLTVIELHHKKPKYNKVGRQAGHIYYWLCNCKCGNKVVIRGADLTFGKTKSCGCYRKENPNKYKHGLRDTKIYKIWINMKTRCYNPKSQRYKSYGARGITVCQEWQDDFMNFYNWAINNGYQENLSIERINVNGNYEPNNCTWIILKDQHKNKTKTKFETYNNQTKTRIEWAEEYNISYTTLRARLDFLHWDIHKALTTPIQVHTKPVL